MLLRLQFSAYNLVWARSCSGPSRASVLLLGFYAELRTLRRPLLEWDPELCPFITCRALIYEGELLFEGQSESTVKSIRGESALQLIVEEPEPGALTWVPPGGADIGDEDHLAACKGVE
ncbi:hypothetical protein NQZ68_021154 [Dissostichus eleginoides]|nr:hypothetical protein NQZ68_021154 [Dissostichus eleginoides]